MEEGEIFEWTNTIHLIDDFIASQTGGFIEIRPVHHFMFVFVEFYLLG